MCEVIARRPGTLIQQVPELSAKHTLHPVENTVLYAVFTSAVTMEQYMHMMLCGASFKSLQADPHSRRMLLDATNSLNAAHMPTRSKQGRQC